MRQTHIALAALLTLAACETAPPEPPLFWFHPTATQAQSNTDQWECSRDAAMAAPPSQRITTTGGFRVGTTWIPQNISSYDDNEMRRMQLHAMCMMARGWRAAPTDPFANQRRAATRPAAQQTAAPQDRPIVLTPEQQSQMERALEGARRDPGFAAWEASRTPAR